MDASQRKARWADRYPDLGRGPLPVGPCTSEEYFERERERVFRRSWLYVARSGEVASPGDYVVRELEVLRTSALVVRGRDGRVRAFHNVCKHRGNRLAHGRGSGAKAFRCGFHGWAYDSAGALVHVPDEDEFDELDRGACGLTALAADEWEGFVFVNANPAPAETLREFLGELAAQLEGYPFTSMQPVGRYTASIVVNWKVFMSAFQECYHVPFLHRRTVPDAATGRDNPMCHLLSMRLYERHRTCSVYANPRHTPSPAEALAFKHGVTVIQGEAARDEAPAGVNPDRVDNWAFDMNGVFPNLIVHVGNGFYYTLVFWPLAVDRTRWDVALFMREPQNAGQRISQEFSKILTRDLYREDLSTAEAIQANLASGALTHFPLSDQELLVRHTFETIDRAVSAA